MATNTDPLGAARAHSAVTGSAPAGGVLSDTALTDGALSDTALTDGALADLEAGLDALESVTAPKTSPLTRLRRTVLPPAVAILLFIGVWQLVWSLHVKPDWLLPSPAQTWREAAGSWSQWDVGAAVFNSVYRGLSGFAVAMLIGTPIGLAVWRSRAVRTALGPILSGLQNLPSVAWVPIGILWFGISPATIYLVVLVGAVPSIAIGVVSGLDQVPPLYLQVGRNLGARGLSAARHILLAAAAPGYLAGLKQGWAFAWRSLMAAELIAVAPQLGPGLGQLLEQGRNNTDAGQSFTAILLIFLAGVGINAVIFAPLEHRILRDRGLNGSRP
jgi:NitT/TauT family transport system permease protein